MLGFWREDAVMVNPAVEARGREEVVAYWVRTVLWVLGAG